MLKAASLTFATALCALAATGSTELCHVQQRRASDPSESLPGMPSRRAKSRRSRLMTYKDARPLAKSIKEAVLTKKMPPWFADPQFGHLLQRPLPVATGDRHHWSPGWTAELRKATRKMRPQPRDFFDGLAIGKPDMVLQMPKPSTFRPAAWSTTPMSCFRPISRKTAGFRWPKPAPERAVVMHHVIAFHSSSRIQLAEGRRARGSVHPQEG